MNGDKEMSKEFEQIEEEARKRYSEKTEELKRLNDLHKRLDQAKYDLEEYWGKNNLEDDKASESNLGFQNLITSIEQDLERIDEDYGELEEDIQYYESRGYFPDE
jgi:chromosome segregation ATPase